MKNEEIEKTEQTSGSKEATPTPPKKRGRPRKEKKEEEVRINKAELTEILQEREESGIIEKKERSSEKEEDKIKEIKKVIDKEFGGEVESPKTLEDRLSLAENHLKEMSGIVKELRENAKKNIEEFNRLFKSDNIMGNLINKIWWEADKYDELNEEIVFLEGELKRAEESKNELEIEIKSLKKEIKERDFGEGRKRSKIVKEEDVMTIENSEEKLKELKDAESEKEFVDLEKRMDEIIKEQEYLKISKGRFTEEEYKKKQEILQGEFDKLGEEIARRLKEAEVL